MNKYGICKLGFIPLRKEADHRSEMVSQLLFGETYSVVDKRGEWLQVVQTFDNYTGWITSKVFCPVKENFMEEINKETPSYSTGMYQQAGSKDQFVMLGFGSRLPLWDGAAFFIGDEEFVTRGEVRHEEADLSSDGLLNMAMSLLGTPYIWGGKSTFGIDCSGFVQTIFKFKSLYLPRDAYQQEQNGIPIDFSNRKQNDLAFFSNEYGRVVHVGLLLSMDKIIHASGRVRIDRFDEKGIFNEEGNEYTHSLASIRRLFD